MNYTKGKWKYHEELGAKFSRISGEETVVCGLPNPIPTGDDEQDIKELNEMRANANLIAAAPEMYEALKAAQLYIARIELNKNQLERTPLEKQIMQALTKAEGGHNENRP
jgi:hypothetical protein